MSTEERRRREKEQRRMAIMDAAERLIFAHGADNTSMDEIAEAAELSKGLLYFYFKSKEDLMHSIVHRGLNILHGMFLEVLSENDRGIDQARSVGEAYIRFAHQYPNYFGLMAWFETERTAEPEPGTYSMECQEEGKHVLALVARAVENGIKDATIRADLNPEVTAVMLWGLTHGIVQIAGYKQHGHDQRVEPNLLLDTTLDFISRGLKPTPDSEKNPTDT